jgi:hypothetical protein
MSYSTDTSLFLRMSSDMPFSDLSPSLSSDLSLFVHGYVLLEYWFDAKPMDMNGRGVTDPANPAL